MYIPMRQKVTVTPPGEEDMWSNTADGEPFDLKCRADEKTQIVKNSMGEEVVSNVELMFKRIPTISYEDVVSYTNEVGVTIRRHPQLIAPARGLSSKPVYTSVYL